VACERHTSVAHTVLWAPASTRAAPRALRQLRPATATRRPARPTLSMPRCPEVALFFCVRAICVRVGRRRQQRRTSAMLPRWRARARACTHASACPPLSPHPQSP
jgi:hypothetical protein